MTSDSPPMWEPRIRHITGVGIHELVPPAPPPARGGGSFPFGPPPGGSPRARRSSHAGHDVPPLHGRARAPTLAGEGRDGHIHHPPAAPPPTTVPPVMEERALARCFIALVLPGEKHKKDEADARRAASPVTEGTESPPASPTPSSASASRRRTRMQPDAPKPGRTRTTSLPPKPAQPAPRPVRKASVSSVASAPAPSPVPSSPSPGASSPAPRRPKQNGTSPIASTASPKTTPLKVSPATAAAKVARPSPVKLSPAKVAPAKVSATTASPKRPAPVVRRSTTLGFPARPGDRRAPPPPPPPVPFFLSAIHPPSTHPRWAHLETGDFAPWLGLNEAAGTQVEVQVWLEEGKGESAKWRQLPGVGGVMDLTRLVPCRPGQVLEPNTVQWTFSAYPKSVFYLPAADAPPLERDVERGVVERSLRETRMKHGPSVGALHQLVNIQSVIADTQRSIDDLQRRIDSLITGDVDRSTLKRDVSERGLKVRWVRDRVSEVERTIEEARARITLHRGRVSARRALLAAAVEHEETTKSEACDLARQIADTEDQRSALLPQIYSLRAHHAQTLDSLFPIEPLHPLTLLYSIVGVPLPIPLGPKDPAPPLTLAPALIPDGCPRVDERTTSAALGYAALVVHLISLLGGAAAGLAYPVTYAGSRSHVRDVVSVMNGPRSFPLYGKGVERYRYEYAVFLLNKDIELLMHESDIRMLDLRHTLPNLKNLLLTLSSPEPPPSGPVSGPGWASGAASRASSRQPSSAWSLPSRHLRSVSATSFNFLVPAPATGSIGTSLASAGPTSDESGSVSANASAVVGQGGPSTPSRSESPQPLWASPQRSRLHKSHTASSSGTPDDRECDDSDSEGTQTEGYVVGKNA